MLSSASSLLEYLNACSFHNDSLQNFCKLVRWKFASVSLENPSIARSHSPHECDLILCFRNLCIRLPRPGNLQFQALSETCPGYMEHCEYHRFHLAAHGVKNWTSQTCYFSPSPQANFKVSLCRGVWSAWYVKFNDWLFLVVRLWYYWEGLSTFSRCRVGPIISASTRSPRRCSSWCGSVVSGS